MTTFQLILVLAVVILPLTYLLFQDRAIRLHQKWERLAREFGLSAGPPPRTLSAKSMYRPSMSGLMEGRPLEFWECVRGQGRSARSYTVLRLEVKPAFSSELTAKRRGVGQRLMKGLGFSDSEMLGVPELDEALQFTAFTSEDKVRLRQPDVRNALLRLMDVSDVSMERAWLQLDHEGHLYEAEQRRTLAAVRDFARALNAAEDTEQVDAAVLN